MTTVLITGGSEGIGKEFARYFAQIGYDLILTGRSMPKLSDVKTELENQYAENVQVICEDLSQKGAAGRLYQKLNGRKIDIFINNAGFGCTGKSWEIPVEKEEDMIGVNVMVMMSLCKYIMHDQIQKGKGLVINVASTGAFQPGPYIAGYYASKAFVLRYTQAVHVEAEPYGVQVCALCPGPTDTAFYEKSGGKMSSFHMSPQKVVRYCMKHTDKTVIVPGFTNRLMRIVPVPVRVFFLKHWKKK